MRLISNFQNIYFNIVKQKRFISFSIYRDSLAIFQGKGAVGLYLDRLVDRYLDRFYYFREGRCK